MPPVPTLTPLAGLVDAACVEAGIKYQIEETIRRLKRPDNSPVLARLREELKVAEERRRRLQER
jgi:hypothetical protein